MIFSVTPKSCLRLIPFNTSLQYAYCNKALLQRTAHDTTVNKLYMRLYITLSLLVQGVVKSANSVPSKPTYQLRTLR